MARLPTPGQDDGTWGGILNGFLGVAHNSDGTLQSNSVGVAQLQDGSVTAAKLSQTYIQTSQIGQANGVASLDSTSKISASALPTGATVNDVSNAQTAANEALAGIPYVSSPTDNYLLGWNGLPELFTSNVAPTAGEVYLQRITVVENGTISDLYFFVTSAGSNMTSGHNFVGLYDSSGTRQGVSADCSSTWTSTHVAKIPLTAALPVTKGQQLYVAMIFNGTTMPQLAGGAQSYWDLPNIGGGVSDWTNPSPPYNSLAPNRWRYMSWSSGVTSLPSTIDLDFANPDKAFWAGVA